MPKVDRIPDLFHMMNDATSVMKYAFHRLKIGVDKSITDVTNLVAEGIDVAKNRANLGVLKEKLRKVLVAQKEYQRHLRRLSTSLHPFVILTGTQQNSTTVESTMQASLTKIKTIKERYEIPDKRNKLQRIERQIPAAAKQVNLWWGWIETSLDSADITLELKEWLIYYLLPYIYWQKQINKTNSKKIRRFYKLSVKAAGEKLKAHRLTPLMYPDEETASEWVKWAHKMSNIFLRTTSAVEGRNGWLSQIHFNGRGLTEKRITSQTTIHNYYLKRSDGTTACERLSEIKPDDLFEYILKKIVILPEPRKGRKRARDNPLILKDVPP